MKRCSTGSRSSDQARAGNTEGLDGVGNSMELELSDEAATLLSKRGRVLVIDLIRPTG